MTDQTTPGGAMPPAAGATPAQSAAGPAATTPPATGATGPAPTDDPALGDAGKRALEAERTAARDALKRAEAAEKALKALQDAQLSETEKRDKRLAELESAQAAWELERQTLTLQRAVERQAAKAGADPELTLAMVLSNRAAIEFETDGSPKNLDKLVGDLVKTKPGLLVSRPVGSPDAGTGGHPGPAASFTREQLRDPVFFQKNRDAIMAAQREGRITG